MQRSSIPGSFVKRELSEISEIQIKFQADDFGLQSVLCQTQKSALCLLFC